MPLTFRQAIPVLVASALVAPAFAAQEINLSYRWQAGDKLSYSMTSESTQDQTAMGQQSHTSASTTQVIAIEVISVDENGNSTIKQKTESVKISMTAPGGIEMNYDSEAESNASAANNPTIASLAALDGSEFTVVIAPDGSVVDLPDYDDWKQNAMTSATPDQKRLLASAPDKDALSKNIEGTYKALAGKTVKKGEGWTTEMRNEFGGGAAMVFTFDNTVVEIAPRSGDKQADIQTVGKIDLEAPANPNMEFKITEQKLTGKSTYSSEKGAIISSTGSMHLVMAAGMPGASPMMTMTTDQHSEMKLLSFERGG
ncbi:MAG: DUF6263 family protein [Phycisphaerales bacterium]